MQLYIETSADCNLCLGAKEDCAHLFFGCPFFRSNRIDKPFQGSTQLQRCPSWGQSGGAAVEGGQRGFVYSRCFGPYDCTQTTNYSMRERRLLIGSPMLWRVLWQVGSRDQGVAGPNVLANYSDGSVTNFLADHPFYY